MWLPSSLYESLPWAYVLIGILFIGGVYYVALGVACIACGLLVAGLRRRMRSAGPVTPAAEDLSPE